MMERNDIETFYSSVENTTELCTDLLLKTCLEFVTAIGFGDLDTKESYIEKKIEGYSLGIVAANGTKCPLYIDISEMNVDIQLNLGGEYLYLQPITNWTDVKNLRDALKDVFYNPIEEKILICNGVNKKVTYDVPYRVENEIRSASYSSSFGFCWFWQIRKEQITQYDPWLILS